MNASTALYPCTYALSDTQERANLIWAAVPIRVDDSGLVGDGGSEIGAAGGTPEEREQARGRRREALCATVPGVGRMEGNPTEGILFYRPGQRTSWGSAVCRR